MIQDLDEVRQAHNALLQVHDKYIATYNKMRTGDPKAREQMPEVIHEYQEAAKLALWKINKFVSTDHRRTSRSGAGSTVITMCLRKT